MIIVDKLSLKTLFIILKTLINTKSAYKHKTVELLDRVNSNSTYTILIYVFSLGKLKVKDANFYAGHSYTSNGENIYVKARHLMFDISYKMARETIKSNKLIDELNKYWQNNTLLLF